VADEQESTTAAQQRIVRVYVCSTFDMTQEREHLTSVVFPRLREFCKERSVHFEAVDLRGAATSEAEVLDACFEEIDRCRPFFIGILGNRYGWIPQAIPDDLLRKHEWLRQYSGRSLPELEILHGALNDPKAAPQARFYFRDPQYTDRRPPDERQEHVEDEPSKRDKLGALREEIRRSGLAVRENYPTPQELGEMILADLTAALNELCPPAARPAAERPPYADENVQFTVYRPRTVQPGKWYPLLAFAHLSERSPDAPQDEPDPVQEVRRQAGEVFGEAAEDLRVGVDSPQEIPREGEITFVPEIAGVQFNPPRASFLWMESVHRADFRLRASAELDGRTARGRMSVFLGGILLAEVGLAVRVDSGLEVDSKSAPMGEVAARPFRKIFASYSHKDRRIVEEHERFVETLGDRYLRDCRDLHAGQDWNEALKALIRQADVFQLFWSWNSMTSPFVRAEWEYALSLDRPNFVRPTYWEEPLPSTREPELPPEALRRLHFQRIAWEPGGAAARHAPAVREAPPDESLDTAFAADADEIAEVEGISIFDEDDLETEPAGPPAEGPIAPSAEDQVPIEGADNGSGLLDLTRESDDTSLGTEVLDHIDEMEGAACSDEAVPAAEAAGAAFEPYDYVPAMSAGGGGMLRRRPNVRAWIILIAVLGCLLAAIVLLAVKYM
jgi:hypothetical protein